MYPVLKELMHKKARLAIYNKCKFREYL